MRCRICGKGFEGNYCPNCGATAQPLALTGVRLREAIRLGGSTVWTVAVLSFIALLISYVVVLFVGVETIVPNILSSGREVGLFIITPIPARFIELEGFWFVGWYFFIFVALFLSILWLFFKSSKPTWNVIKKPLEDLWSRLGSNSSIALIAQLFFAILFFNFAYYYILGLVNVSPNLPQMGGGEFWESMFFLANASVYEEIVTRILFIGLPLFLITYASGARIRRKNISRYILGGGFKLKRVTMILLLFSSMMFAVAHVFNWDIYKVPPAFLAGLALGYLYLKKGIFASILLHFSFNYLNVLATMLESNITATFILAIVITLVGGLVAGAFFFAYYIERTHRYFATRGAPPPSEPQEGEEEARIYFQCPRCAGVEARYSEEGFECLNCGYKT